MKYKLDYHFFDGYTNVYDSIVLSVFNPYKPYDAVNYISQVIKIDPDNIFIDGYMPLGLFA